jgi:protein SCO1/2
VSIRTTLPVSPLLLLLGFALGCTNAASKLPDYGAVPDFSMVDSQGQPFSSRSFAGKISIVDFIYTNCPAECPLMSSQMHKVEQRVREDSDVCLVSISVDPQRDVPPVLNTFAHRYGAPTKQWIFLTGTPATVHLVAYDTFHVGDVLGRIEHSTKFVVVDKHEHIRGYYSSFDQDDLNQMLKDVNALRRQSS